MTVLGQFMTVVGKGLRLMKNCFQKSESRLITFRSGETEKIPGKKIVTQHRLLLMDMVFKRKVRRKVKLSKKLKLWRLRESEMKEDCAEVVNNKCDGNEDWCGLKRKLLDVANEVCGYTKGKTRHFDT